MNVPAKPGAAAEWRAHWPLTLAALVGYSSIGLQSYGIGPFVIHLEREFGWSRADVLLGVSISNAVGIFLNVIVGLIVDRFGSRRVALIGLWVMVGSFGLLASATGALLQWALLWVILAVGVVLVQSTVWTRAVGAVFDRARGLAFAVALSGTPLASMVLPVLGTWLIEDYGWRAAFIGIAAIWIVITFPIVFLFFREKPGQRLGSQAGGDGGGSDAALPPGLSLREGVRTRAFYHLLLSFGCFSFYSMAIATNLVPLLAETGVSAVEAARIASVMGMVGIVARLSVGFLLDRFPGHIIGTVTLLLPVLGCAVLLVDSPGMILPAIAAGAFGAAIGAEIDVALYLATRHFGLRAFASLFNAIITFGAVNAALSPYVAGWLHDVSGNYDSLLVVVMIVMTIGALAMATLGRPKRSWSAH